MALTAEGDYFGKKRLVMTLMVFSMVKPINVSMLAEYKERWSVAIPCRSSGLMAKTTEGDHHIFLSASDSFIPRDDTQGVFFNLNKIDAILVKSTCFE